MSRVLVIAIAGALLLSAGADMRTSAAGGSGETDIEAACVYYKKRAGPEPLREPVSFVAFLAETCTAARNSIEMGHSDQQVAARQLLSRVAELYTTVNEMNAARDEAVAGLTGVTRMLTLTRVTPTGEFLIAHRMGLFHDFEAWLDTGADFSLAWYR